MTSTLPDQLPDAAEAPRATRRQVFAGTGAVCLLGVGLAACSGDDDGGDDAASSPSASAGGSGEGSVSGGTNIVALDDIEVGGAVSAQIGGEDAIVSRPKDDVVVAFNATCPHQGGTVAPQGAELVCPLHGSTFNAVTGEVTKGPATSSLKEIEVVIDGDNVVTG